MSYSRADKYRLVQKKGTVLLRTSLAWPAVAGAAAGQKLSLNLAPFLLLNPVHCNVQPPKNCLRRLSKPSKKQ